MADTVIFADGIVEAGVRHGVARITLGVQGTDGKAVPSGKLVVPLAQLAALSGSLARLMREVEAKVREQGAQPAAAPAPAQAPENVPLPPAFRFQG